MAVKIAVTVLLVVFSISKAAPYIDELPKPVGLVQTCTTYYMFTGTLTICDVTATVREMLQLVSL